MLFVKCLSNFYSLKDLLPLTCTPRSPLTTAHPNSSLRLTIPMRCFKCLTPPCETTFSRSYVCKWYSIGLRQYFLDLETAKYLTAPRLDDWAMVCAQLFSFGLSVSINSIKYGMAFSKLLNFLILGNLALQTVKYEGLRN